MTLKQAYDYGFQLALSKFGGDPAILQKGMAKVRASEDMDRKGPAKATVSAPAKAPAKRPPVDYSAAVGKPWTGTGR